MHEALWQVSLYAPITLYPVDPAANTGAAFCPPSPKSARTGLLQAVQPATSWSLNHTLCASCTCIGGAAAPALAVARAQAARQQSQSVRGLITFPLALQPLLPAPPLQPGWAWHNSWRCTPGALLTPLLSHRGEQPLLLTPAVASPSGAVRSLQLMPRRIKYRKAFKSMGFNEVIVPNTRQLAFGMYGICAKEHCRLPARTLETARCAHMHTLRASYPAPDVFYTLLTLLHTCRSKALRYLLLEPGIK